MNPAGDQVAVGGVLGLDVFGDKPLARGECSHDRRPRTGPWAMARKLVAEGDTWPLELEAPHRRQQVEEGVVGEEIVAELSKSAETAMELVGQPHRLRSWSSGVVMAKLPGSWRVLGLEGGGFVGSDRNVRSSRPA